MEKANKLIKVSGIIYLIIALLILPYFSVYGGIQLLLGISLLAYSFLPSEELHKKTPILVIIAIISLLINNISAILLFIAFDDISKNKTKEPISIKEEEISSETKKIDILLKIGLGMVLVSGIIFTTTSWDSISNIIKCIILVLIGILFLGLSKFSEIKLKIHKTTKSYYILGLLFFQFTLIAIGIFGVFSKWFTYTGEGKYLVYFLTFSLLSILTFLIHNKFKQEEYKNISYIIIPLSIHYLLMFIGLNLELTLFVISTISIIINILVKDKDLKNITEIAKIISYVIWPILILQKTDNLNIIVIITSIINILNITYTALKNKGNLESIISIIISNILLINIAQRTQLDNADIILFIITSIYYILVNHNKIIVTKSVKNTNQIVYNIIVTITLFTISDSSLKLFICSLIYALINFISSYITNKETSIFDLYYQPVVLLLTVASTAQIISEVINIDIIYKLLSCIIIYSLINFFAKDKKIKKLYYISLIIITILTTLINTASNSIIASILTILSSLYIYKEKKNIWSYMLVLFSILSLKGTLHIYIPIITIDIINIIIFSILTFILKNNNKLKNINLFAMLIPMFSLINSTSIYGDTQIILYNILAFYILFLILILFVKNNKTKDILTTIYSSFIILCIIFKSSLSIGLYVGVVGLILIFLSLNKKEYKSSFYCGVVITILNIVIRIGKYWSKIPFSLYLLIAGIAIILFVTIKELKKNKEPIKNIEKQNEVKIINNEPTTRNIQNNQLEQIYNFCPRCGNKNNENKFCKTCGFSLIIKKQ